MFKHILAPVDGSVTSMTALDKAIGLAQAFDCALTVVYVIDPYPFTGVGTEFAYGQDQYLNAARAEAAAVADMVAGRLKAAGLSSDTRVVESHTVWRGILEAADGMRFDHAGWSAWCWAAWRRACCRTPRSPRWWSGATTDF